MPVSPQTPLRVIARIHSDFPQKFGIPRQSGLADALRAQIVFERSYRNPDALRGIEQYSHIWLIWGFSQAQRDAWSPMVRPPRLGGNTRLGVFATRSPFRPNPIGLSCVELKEIRPAGVLGQVLVVRGADMMDGTPIWDIKPYLPYADCHPEARGGFAQTHARDGLAVDFPPALLQRIPQARREALLGVLAQDPRPAYQHDPQRVYGFAYGAWEIRFTVDDGVLTVRAVEESERK